MKKTQLRQIDTKLAALRERVGKIEAVLPSADDNSWDEELELSLSHIVHAIENARNTLKFNHDL